MVTQHARILRTAAASCQVGLVVVNRLGDRHRLAGGYVRTATGQRARSVLRLEECQHALAIGVLVVVGETYDLRPLSAAGGDLDHPATGTSASSVVQPDAGRDGDAGVGLLSDREPEAG